MPKIRSRKQLRNYILEELGHPVINVELDEKQLNNAIDKAIAYYLEFHREGVEEVLYVAKLDKYSKIDNFITLPEGIIGVHSILNQSGGASARGEDLDNVDHLIANSDIFSESGIDLGSTSQFVRSRQTIENIRYFLDPFYDFEFNKITNKLHFKNDISETETLGIIVYRALDPEYDTDIFNDEWIKKYSVAQAMYMWGFILSKYTGMNLPGQGTINGEGIRDEGKEMIATLLEEFEELYNTPPLPRVE